MIGAIKTKNYCFKYVSGTLHIKKRRENNVIKNVFKAWKGIFLKKKTLKVYRREKGKNMLDISYMVL